MPGSEPPRQPGEPVPTKTGPTKRPLPAVPVKLIGAAIVILIIIIVIAVLAGAGSIISLPSPFSSLNGTNSSTGSSPSVQIHVIYSGAWSGTYTATGITRPVNGTGERTITVDKPSGVINVAIKKKEVNTKLISVELLENGKRVKSGNTTSSQQSVTLSYTVT